MKSRASLLAVAAAGVSLALVAGFGRSLHGQEARGKDALMNPDQLTEPSPAMFKVNIDSSKGPFGLEVHRDWAPNSADRFYNLVKRGYYDDNRFFRVLPGFLVQFGVNGDPTLATAEKGKLIYEAVVPNFVKLVREFKNRARGERTDYHKVEWKD